ncbi:hypothetical protein HDU97_005289 [Phlyctochytrium planicorne]|nr:hypothetical protein HDU97_005289 [Phlyctochytrium planicorne]
MSHGSLMAYYTKNPRPPVADLIQWALDVAYGIQYLDERSPSVIHRDLKSLNILMSLEKGRICAKFTTASDIYAYGIVLSEITSWEGPFGCPWSELSPQKVERMLDLGQSIPIDLGEADVPQSLKDLTQDCTNSQKDLRPSISEIVETLKTISAQHPTQDSSSSSSTEANIQDAATAIETQLSLETLQFNAFATTVPVNEGVAQMAHTDRTVVNFEPPRRTFQLPRRNYYFESHRRDAERGNADSQNWVGLQYLHGKSGVDLNLETAVKWFKLAANQGHPDGQNNLAHQFANGEGVAKDYSEAFKWYLKSAEQGYADAQCNLAVCYKEGYGVAVDYIKAVEWFKKSADQGNAAAQNGLAYSLEHGHGVEVNYEEAMEWYRKSASQAMYSTGTGVEVDYTQSANYYKASADQGNSVAQWSLGLCFEEGLGVEKDLKQAIQWFTKSAENGLLDAQISLANCFKLGTGVEKNLEEALKWYKKCAEQGDLDSMDMVGDCYKNGWGVERNLEEAIKWYTNAAEHGHEYAKQSLEEIKSRTSASV